MEADLQASKMPAAGSFMARVPLIIEFLKHFCTTVGDLKSYQDCWF